MTTLQESAQGDAASSWKTLQVIGMIAGAAIALIIFGMNIGGVQKTGKELSDHIAYSNATYVRKDGAELEGIRRDLRALNDKIDYLIRLRQERESREP